MPISSQKKVILFDIDYTLIDTDKLRRLTQQKILTVTKIPKKELEKATEVFAKTLKTSREFSPQKYAQFLTDYFSDLTLGQKTRQILNEPAIYQQAIYPKVISILKKLKQRYLLGIFSEGIEEFQLTKITFSRIIDHLNRDLIFIFSNKTGQAEKVVKKIGTFFIVDDNPKHITDLMGIEGITPIWLKHGPKAKTKEKLDCPTILSLAELGNGKRPKTS